MKKTVKNILVLCLSMALFSMTAPLVCGCKPESKDDPEHPEPGPDPEPTPEPGKLTSVLTMKIGETFAIPFTGELLLPYTGIKKGDEIVLTTRADRSVK